MEAKVLIENIIELENGGESLKTGETCRYCKDFLSYEELDILLNSKINGYSISSDYDDYNYIVIEKL